MQAQGDYPLKWPQGWKRESFRRWSKFSHTISLADARDGLLKELRALGAENVAISTNLELRLDGLPRGGQAQPTDPGVAVYFTLKKQRTVLACDKWSRIQCNMRAIEKHIEALRGQDRWGVGSIEQAFAGYQALPMNGTDSNWRAFFGLEPDESADVGFITTLFRENAKRMHPDTGGSAREFDLLVKMRDAALKEIGAT